MSAQTAPNCAEQRDQDQPARPSYARAADVKVGDVLITDDGFTCMPAGAEKIVQTDEDGELCIPCDHGLHQLEGQLDYADENEGFYVGLTLKAPSGTRSVAARNLFDAPPADTLAALRYASIARQVEWAGGAQEPLPVLFKATELGGEAGEVLNVVKKLERERLGWGGSRATIEHLADELADLVICADLLAEPYGIDLAAAIVRKFNATSDARGLATRLADRIPVRWRHVARGGVYEEVGRARVQASVRNVDEDDTVVVYRGEVGNLWAREEGEFEDGRFTRMEDR